MRLNPFPVCDVFDLVFGLTGACNYNHHCHLRQEADRAETRFSCNYDNNTFKKLSFEQSSIAPHILP